MIFLFFKQDRPVDLELTFASSSQVLGLNACATNVDFCFFNVLLNLVCFYFAEKFCMPVDWAYELLFVCRFYTERGQLVRTMGGYEEPGDEWDLGA